MIDILDRAMVFTKRDHVLDEEMKINVKDGKLQVSGKNDYGWFKEIANVEYKGEPTSFWISPTVLQSILERSEECVLGTEKLKFDGADWEFVAVLREK
jgi:hypothetical protein